MHLPLHVHVYRAYLMICTGDIKFSFYLSTRSLSRTAVPLDLSTVATATLGLCRDHVLLLVSARGAGLHACLPTVVIARGTPVRNRARPLVLCLPLVLCSHGAATNDHIMLHVTAPTGPKTGQGCAWAADIIACISSS